MNKFAFIMRGVPGSGKTTTANFLAGSKGSVHSIDDLHMNEEGNFLWNDDKEHELYEKNFVEFVSSLDKNLPVVICDCINIVKKDYLKYVNAASSRGYITSTVLMNPPAPEVAAMRNTHNVSKEQILEMYESWATGED